MGARDFGLPPVTPRPVNRPTPEEVDRHGDDLFKKSIADLSRRLEERAQQASDPRAAAELRRAALLAYNTARTRRLKLLAGAGGAAVAVACIAWFVVAISTPESEATASAAPPATKIETASAAAPVAAAPATASVTTPPATPVATTAPSPAPPQPAPSAADVAPPSTELPPPAAAAATPPTAPTPSAPPPAASTPTTPEPKAVPTTVASTNDPAPAPAAPPAATSVTPAPIPPAADTPATPTPAALTIPAEVPLQRKEINEIQTRLYTFGFNPGPIDGSPGPMTQIAAMRYRAERKLPQTDAINRELLEALRQDPAPQVAQAPPPPRPASQRTYYTQRRSDDPFESLRIAGDKFGRWLQSLGNN
ncbi:MAG: hypothetical protein J0H44_15155 [Alphaproteobacteria bacterium]|nr:hypothetical protein [Alphaproteobacteria bacterium]